jgi:hypothetical protein
MSTLLAHLATKFSDQNEVVATDALAFVLRHSPPATKTLAQLLGSVAGEPIPVTRVSPQYVAGDESRPDLATFSDDNKLTAFLEAKFWAGLTDAQPLEYLRRLREQGGRALLFIVPEERVASVSVHLEERAKAAAVQLSVPSTIEGVRSAKTPGGIRLMVISWKRLLAVLTAGCVRAEDEQAVANLDQLSGLVARFEAEGFGPMSPAELTDLSVPRRVKALADLVQAVIAKGEADKLINLGGTRPTHDWTSAGRYLSLPHGNGWLGIDHDAWARYQSTPLWLWFPANGWGRAVDVRRALQGWEVGDRPRAYVNEDDSVSVPMFIRAAVERDEAVGELVQQLESVDRALAAAGLVGGPGTPPAPA